MTSDELLKLSQWQTTMALMDVTMESIEDSSWDDGENSFYSVLDDLENMERRMANPNAAMKAALLSREMGITVEMINRYTDYLQDQEAAAEQERLQKEIAANPALNKLTSKFKYREIEDPDRYPNHYHFSFTTSDGIPVTARMFHPSWGDVRIWFEWINAAGKKVKVRKDIRFNNFVLPKSFPQSLSVWHGQLRNMSLILTHLVVTNKLPSNLISLKPVL